MVWKFCSGFGFPLKAAALLVSAIEVLCSILGTIALFVFVDEKFYEKRAALLTAAYIFPLALHVLGAVCVLVGIFSIRHHWLSVLIILNTFTIVITALLSLFVFIQLSLAAANVVLIFEVLVGPAIAVTCWIWFTYVLVKCQKYLKFVRKNVPSVIYYTPMKEASYGAC